MKNFRRGVTRKRRWLFTAFFCCFAALLCCLTSISKVKAEDSYTVTYHANGGTFKDGSDTNVVTYGPATEKVTKTSKTSNVSGDGSSYSGGYGDNKTLTDKVTIPGAKLQLLDQNKTVIKEWTSGTEPTNFDYIPSGTYYIHEASAPFGYDISEDKEIHIESKADMQSFEITDDKLYELPFTGKKDIYYIIFICVGIALIALVNRRKIRM